MDKLCSELYQKKLEINSALFSRINNSEKKFILKNDLSDFKVMSNFIPKIFEILWENPKITADLIKYCDIDDIRETLANLFVNNFYQNILSNNYIENNLMFLLTLLIKDEINDLKNGENFESFLDSGSKVGYFIDELRKKNDVKCIFKNSILNIIADFEAMSSINFTLDIGQIVDRLKSKSLYEKSKIKENNIEKITSQKRNSDEIKEKIILPGERSQSCFYFFSREESNDKNEDSQFEQFAKEYIKPLTVSSCEKIRSELGTTNSNKNDYLTNIINNAKSENSYSNYKLLEKFNFYHKYSDKLTSIYISNFYLIKDFLDKFLEALDKNIIMLPYYVKCLCKIISVLIQKKFPDINIAKKNAFISQFLFKKLIMPIFADPGMELLINNFIISGFTLSNLNIINELLDKLFSGQLFCDNNNIHKNNYTTFNWYFIEKMPLVYNIFNKITDIELPSFIDDLINDKLDPNFCYNYFELNKGESITHNSICFSYSDLNAILLGFNKLKEKVDLTQYKEGNLLLKSLEKFNSDRNKDDLYKSERRNNNVSFVIVKGKERSDIDNIDDIDINNHTNSNPFLYVLKNKEKSLDNIYKEFVEINCESYYLIQNLKFNAKENKEIFDLTLESKYNYHIKELKTKDNPENIKKNVIIKIKNFLSDLLYNIDLLNKSNFIQSKISNTNEILNSINNYFKLSNFILVDTIPHEWYIESILNLIKNIPEEYAKNDLEKLYNEMEEEITLSMNNYNMDLLHECSEKLKHAEKEKKYYEIIYNIFKDLELNEKVKIIVENDFIPVKISFNYDEQHRTFKSFDIKKSKTKKKEFMRKESKVNIKNNKTYTKRCHSIKTFIENFPDFCMFYRNKDIDILEIEKSLLIPEKLKQYFFSIIREHLISEKKIENNDLVQIENKIYDYVMTKINPKIFPKEYSEDNNLFKNIFMLSWIEPKHFIQEKSGYIFETFLPEVIKNFGVIEDEPSPRKKIEYINSIFESISKVVLFNGGDKPLGVEDEIPILSYCFVKAQLKKIYSNLKFIQIYRNSLIEKGEENKLIQLIAVCDFIKDIKYKNINGVSEDEYNQKCKEAINKGAFG